MQPGRKGRHHPHFILDLAKLHRKSLRVVLILCFALGSRLFGFGKPLAKSRRTQLLQHLVGVLAVGQLMVGHGQAQVRKGLLKTRQSLGAGFVAVQAQNHLLGPVAFEKVF